jgi:hypothetical protein
MKSPKKLSRDHFYILSLLDCAPMDIRTLTNVSFGTKKRINKIVEDLVVRNLIERIWDNGGFLYRKI